MTNKNGFSKILKSYVPDGPIDKKWTSHKNKINLVSPAGLTRLILFLCDVHFLSIGPSGTYDFKIFEKPFLFVMTIF